MNREHRETEFLVLAYTYENKSGEKQDVDILYDPERDQFFLGISDDEFLIRRFIKEEGLRYARYNGMIYAPLTFFRRIAALLPEDDEKRDTGWIDQIEENGRRHLIVTDFQGGDISVTVN